MQEITKKVTKTTNNAKKKLILQGEMLFAQYKTLHLPVGEFWLEEAFPVLTETTTSMSGLLCHMWDQSLQGKHPTTQFSFIYIEPNYKKHLLKATNTNVQFYFIFSSKGIILTRTCHQSITLSPYSVLTHNEEISSLFGISQQILD